MRPCRNLSYLRLEVAAVEYGSDLLLRIRAKFTNKTKTIKRGIYNNGNVVDEHSGLFIYSCMAEYERRTKGNKQTETVRRDVEQ